MLKARHIRIQRLHRCHRRRSAASVFLLDFNNTESTHENFSTAYQQNQGERLIGAHKYERKRTDNTHCQSNQVSMQRSPQEPLPRAQTHI